MTDSQLEVLERIERLLRILVKSGLREVAAVELADTKLEKLYRLTGDYPISDLVQRTGYSAGKISGIWQRWERLGLLVKDGSRFVRVL